MSYRKFVNSGYSGITEIEEYDDNGTTYIRVTSYDRRHTITIRKSDYEDVQTLRKVAEDKGDDQDLA